jgi:hypothetical protein
MFTRFLVFALSNCLLISCITPVRRTIPDDTLLSAYAQQTELTDPGEYLYLYDGLPQALDSLCLLIKCQLIHPMEALQMGYPLDQVIEEGAIETTEEILEELLKRDSAGLTIEREPDDRLLIACHHHAMLLTSILRARDIPVRMRFGFARYFEKEAGVRFGHVICEVWNDNEQRWMLVDPDRQYVDFSPDRFDYAHEAWRNLTRKKLDQKVYVSSIGNGLKGAVNLVAMDGAHVLQQERMNWVYPKIAMQEISGFDDLEGDEWIALDEAATLLADPDKYFSKLDSLFDHYPGFQASDFDYEDYCTMLEERGE